MRGSLQGSFFGFLSHSCNGENQNQKNSRLMSLGGSANQPIRLERLIILDGEEQGRLTDQVKGQFQYAHGLEFLIAEVRF